MEKAQFVALAAEVADPASAIVALAAVLSDGFNETNRLLAIIANNLGDLADRRG